MTPLVLSSSAPLPAAVVGSPCIAAALAGVVQCDLDEGDVCDVERVASVLHAHERAWHAALATWAAHRAMAGDGTGASNAHLAFRVATLRAGEHSFTSKALDAAFGDAISRMQPEWRVDLEAPDVMCIGLLVQRRLTFGVLLPPFAPRRADVLPFEPRMWLCAGRDRPHTRPSRAACLARLARPCAHERLLDPCGGIGVLAMEAASLAAVHATCVDNDALACAAASANSRAASAAGALRGTVDVVHADALHLPLPASSIDVVLTDLPFGLRHARLDVGALMRELARLVVPGAPRTLAGRPPP